MSAQYIEAVYGHPPLELATVGDAALQVSPLIPGAQVLESVPPLNGLTILAPSGTIERRYAMALALRALVSGAALTVLAPKDRGGARLGDELRGFGCVVSEISKRHHRICTAQRPAEPLNLDEAIRDGAPRLDDSLGLWTQPGIFSWNRIDPGSALLMQHLPKLGGQGADLGCGLGILAHAVLASPKVTALHLIDLDRRAVEAARRNVADPRAQFHWADVLRDESLAGGLDFIVMNPPFHQGGSEDQTLGQRFIARAAALLRKGGTCWLTANRHLPYEAVLKTVFKRVTAVADADGYKIFEAQK